jgi:hypothetical protein
MDNGLFSLSGPWPIVVFSEDGEIVDENVVIAYTRLIPKRLFGIAPLRVGFGRAESKAIVETNVAVYSKTDWQLHTQKMVSAYRAARAEWEAEQKAKK